jgi:H+/Cl- antiporter ClcA
VFGSVSRFVRSVVLGAAVGLLAGLSSAAFLTLLRWMTDARVDHGWLLYLLPVGGLVVGLTYHHLGGRAAAGSTLIVDQIHTPTEWVPRRLAPLVLIGTLVTHLFGGSAGREGTALQMSGSLTDAAARALRLPPEERRSLLIAALSGGFGAVFGVPVAGFLFGLEVRSFRRVHPRQIVPALTAAFIGDRLVRALGVTHTHFDHLHGVDVGAGLLATAALIGIACGLTGLLFIQIVHRIKSTFVRAIGWAPARPLIGGALVIILTLIVGNRDYLGLSLPLMNAALAGGAGVVAGAFALKLVFTALTLGSGFLGGEVTPLFVIGATLGAVAGRVLDAPVPVTAALGFVGVFAGAANTPVACVAMGIELFGRGPAVLMAVVCAMSYACSTHRGIYGSRRRGPSAVGGSDAARA